MFVVGRLKFALWESGSSFALADFDRERAGMSGVMREETILTPRENCLGYEFMNERLFSCVYRG